MKIGILVDRVIVGGVSKIAIEQVRALREKGVDVHLVVLRKEGLPNRNFLTLKPNEIVYLDSRLPKVLKKSFKFPMFHFFSFFHLSYPFIIPFVIKKNEFDYLIVHGTFTAFSAIGIKIIKRIRFSVFIWDPISYIIARVYSPNIPKIVYLTLSKIAILLDKTIIKFSEFVLVGGKAHNKFILKYKSKNRVIIIPPSTDPIDNLKTLKKKDYVVMSTAWKKGKNPEYIITILKQLPKLQIIMVGKWLDIEYKASFIKLLDENGYKNNVTFTDQVTESELKKFYSESIALLQTNDDRGFGMPALEAAGCATTFIIPNGQGVCDLFEDKVHGFYTKELDTHGIVSKIKLLTTNRKLAISMGIKAHKKVVETYSWKIHADKLLNVVR